MGCSQSITKKEKKRINHEKTDVFETPNIVISTTNNLDNEILSNHFL